MCFPLVSIERLDSTKIPSAIDNSDFQLNGDATKATRQTDYWRSYYVLWRLGLNKFAEITTKMPINEKSFEFADSEREKALTQPERI